MTIDYDALLLDPIYDGMGIAATLVSQDAIETALTVKNEASPLVLESANSPLHIGTSAPMVRVRLAELAEKEVTRESLKGSSLTFNGATYKIVAAHPIPKPEGKGEYSLKLQSAAP